MDIQIIPGYDHPQKIRELFSEYTQYVIDGDSGFREYLQMQNFDEEIAHLDYKYGRPGGRLYLAVQGEHPVGCIALRQLDDKRCEMKRLYVRPEYQGKHIGRLLVNKTLDAARRIGYRHMVLDTFPFLNKAIHMYRDLGFYDIPRYNDSPMDNTVYFQKDL